MIGKKRLLLKVISRTHKKKIIKAQVVKETKPAIQEENGGLKTRRIHLSVDQAQIKIDQLELRLIELSGPKNKKIRQRLYHDLSQLKKAVTNPNGNLVDPQVEEQKKQEDYNRRVNKKKDKKQLILKEIKRDKKKHSDKVCLICKLVGHIASDCRENTTSQQDIVCYSCGSKEHTLKDCSQKFQNTSLKFAQCFLCKEIGHISGQCPQNKNGIYSKGGSCFICGKVDHLKQDCPKNPVNQIRNERNNKFNEEFFDEND